MKFIKHFLIALLTYLPILLHGQASSSANFQLKVKFDKSIPVAKVQPFYFVQSGNGFRTITYTIDVAENTIVLSGRNDFILWVSFPTLVFSVKQENVGDETGERYSHFYLVSEGPLASYTGKQTKEFKFSAAQAVIVASLQLHRHDDTHNHLQIETRTTYPGEQHPIPVTTEIVKITRK